jgi:hypothetical protein
VPRSSFACRRFWFKLMTAASKFKISTLSKKRARMREQNQNPHPPTKNAGRVGHPFLQCEHHENVRATRFSTMRVVSRSAALEMTVREGHELVPKKASETCGFQPLRLAFVLISGWNLSVLKRQSLL